MQYVSAADPKQDLASLLETAQREPVVIRREGKDVAVLLSSQEYERIRALNIAEFQDFCDRIAEAVAARGLSEDKLASILADDN